jgi:F-type H+-transporting ATPase subunit delta
MSKAAPRYAKALLESLSASGELEKTVPVLRGLASVPDDLSARLGDPTIPSASRESALLSALGSPASGSILGRLVSLLSARRRLGEAPAVAASLLEQLESRSGIVRGKVRARELLSPSQISSLQKTLSVHGAKVELSQESDPNILGGFRIQLGSTVLDATANNQLNQARRALLSA